MWRDIQHIWNPNQDDIKSWAYSDSRIPEQDWELAVINFPNIPMICGLVDDPKCKHTRFFLGCLYVFVGDVVRSQNEQDIHQLTVILKRVTDSLKNENLTTWVQRSLQLIQNPKLYNYEYWGLGSKYVYTSES
ncbi:hypothetical protein ABHN11_13220 [Brevibacillus centrosporus]|uniref:hypothetical protein n=1 Tax=Brevibacillus centrosporus TaxID=54910 RepID=UPI003985FF26